jgi:hypothetical protein
MAIKGSIRMVLGFMITFGAVGTLDADPSASVLVQFTLAMIGLAIAYSGVLANQKQNIG